MSIPFLEVRDLNTHYGKSHVLQGINLTIHKGDCLALLGRNGAGKSTTLRSIVNLTKPSSGTIKYMGENITNHPPYKISSYGITLVPENRGILKTLTLEENLKIASNKKHKDDWNIEKVLEIFPALKSKYYNSSLNLSGGEQQMLAIARALLLNPKLILLDEPSQGLAPKIVLQIEEILHKLLKKNISILLVEQNLKLALALATNISIIGKGLSRWEGKKLNFTKNVNKYKEWISV